MSATLWDSFENLLHEAQEHFLNFRYFEALGAWNKYYEITAKNEFRHIPTEVSGLLEIYFNRPPAGNADLYRIFSALREQLNLGRITPFSFDLFKKLIVQFYREFKQDGAGSANRLEQGVLDYLSGNFEQANSSLRIVLQDDLENVAARTYLGFTLIALHEQKEALTLLTENLFLAADKLNVEDLYLSQFKLLHGKLHSDTGNREESAWLLTFESWYRSYLVFSESKDFFKLMQQKERNERIIQVKYYKYERYRHFARCLYLAEYIRQYQKEQRELLHEQEVYMQKLDRELFARYRKKRKEI